MRLGLPPGSMWRHASLYKIWQKCKPSGMFCVCGTLIYVASNSTKMVCLRCKRENGADMIEPMHTEVEVRRDVCAEAVGVKGARIKHRCPGCGADEMMYNTVQLRSADEGQTVFYTCECGHKITMHS